MYVCEYLNILLKCIFLTLDHAQVYVHEPFPNVGVCMYIYCICIQCMTCFAHMYIRMYVCIHCAIFLDITLLLPNM